MPNHVQPTERPARDAIPRGTSVPAVATACRILNALAELRPGGATLSQLARQLDLSKSSMHAQLATLRAYGFVERDDVTRRFCLGSALVRLGHAASTAPDAASLVAERLPGLAGEYQVTFATAAVEAPDKARLIDCAYPHRAMHVGLELGRLYGPFDGAIGKCLLAAMAPEVARRIVKAGPIPRHTSRTMNEPGELLADVELVRARGWGSSAGELKENHAVAAPLLGGDGPPELILCAVGFPSELPEAQFATIGASLLETAAAIQAALMRPVPDD